MEHAYTDISNVRGEPLLLLESVCITGGREFRGIITLRIIVNNKENQAVGISDIDGLLSSIAQTDDLEIWISHEGGQSLSALLNENCGWLMYLRFPEDAGFSSRNADRSDQASETEVFFLANGQADSYPRSWTLNRSDVFAAILEFAKSSDQPKAVAWHDDTTS